LTGTRGPGQRDASQAFAKRASFEIADGDWYGLARLLDRIEGNGVSTVIVEDARCPRSGRA
jgi:hypothetical protein